MSRSLIFFRLVLIGALVTACGTEPQGVAGGGGERSHPVLSASVGGPLPGLSQQERRLFDAGKVQFERVFTPATGLGPLFNGNSCATCHAAPAAGGVGPQIERHATAFVGGTCEEHEEINGGSVMQSDATPLLRAAGISEERLATELPGLATGRRTTPDLFGFGLLEAVPAEEILRRADPNDLDGDGVSGRPNINDDGELGRFGRKGQVATLTDFTADAFIYEQGVTNPPDETEEETNFGHELPAGVDPAPDPEISEEDVNLTVAFVQLLAPPTRPILFDESNSGRAVFEAIGCATCHVPELTTGSSHPLPSLRNRLFFAYTDLLLHDMGPDLADICNGSATPSEFRTEPLMGLSLATTFLHDGRARSIEEAIVAHGGEAARARDRFLALTSGARSSLMTFLRSL